MKKEITEGNAKAILDDIEWQLNEERFEVCDLLSMTPWIFFKARIQYKAKIKSIREIQAMIKDSKTLI